jgi:Flp pilus assembly protein TadG
MIRDEHGGALVEFAIVMPLLLLLVGGLVDFGILYYNKQVLTNASREGARAGIVYELDGEGNKIVITEVDVQQIVQTYCSGKLWTFGGSSLPTATASGVGSLIYPADLTVTVSFTHTFLFSSLLNIFGGDLGPTLDISAETVMRME